MLTLGRLGDTQDPAGMPAMCKMPFMASTTECTRIRQLLIQHPNLVAQTTSSPTPDDAATADAVQAALARAATKKKHIYWGVSIGAVVVAVGAGFALDRARKKQKTRRRSS